MARFAAFLVLTKSVGKMELPSREDIEVTKRLAEAGCRVAGGMLVADDDGSRIVQYRAFQHVTWMDDARIQATCVGPVKPDYLVLRVEHHHASRSSWAIYEVANSWAC